MAISQPPFQSTLVDADDRVQTPWAQWFSQLQPVLQAVVASGPTSGRPTQNLFIGYPYFDTTIDQMVYWNGVIWVTYAPSTTGTSILKGNGTGGFNNAIAGIDFAPATSGTAILYGNGGGGFSSVSIGSGVTFVGGVLSATGSGGTVTSVSGTAPIASSGGTTPAISISQAGISTNGYLTSTDWNIFNAKGTVTSVSGTGTVNGITLTGTVTSSGSLTLGGTLGGIGNSQLTNSSLTINGNLVSLGGSTTVTATATNALTIGTGLSGTSYDGSTAVTIANTGVLSITGTANQVIASASTGAVTLSLPQSINSGATPTFTGTNFTGIPNAGLTNSSITINGSSVSLGGSTTVTATATNALTIGTGLSGTSYNGSTAVTIANTGVLSFSGNSTGLTPATATTGAVSLAGVLVASNGGTGVAGTLTGLLYGNGTSAHTVATTAQALSLIGTVPVANGGTGLTTLATGYIPYGNGTSAYNSSSGLTFSAGDLTVSGSFIGAGVSIGNQAPTGTSGTLLFGSGGGLNYIEAGLALTSGSAAPLLFTSIYAANEWARIDASGNLLVGTSSTGGISSNSAKIVGGVINSLNGTTASIANGASTSLATGTANTSFYQVFVNAVGNTTVFASALVYFNGAGTGTLTSIVAVGMSISSSGANIITITNLAGSSQSFSWSIIRYK